MKTSTLKAMVVIAVVGILALISIFVPDSYSQSERQRIVASDEKNSEIYYQQQELIKRELKKNPNSDIHYMMSVLPGPISEPPDTTGGM